MPFNGSGTYSAPSSPGAFNPAVTGQTADPTSWNSLLADISTALSTVICRDGQSTVTADISLNSHKLTDVATATAGTDAVNLTQALALVRSAPVVKTADFGIADTDIWLINNKAGSQCNVTLPDVAANVGRALMFTNYQAFAVASIAFNVRPISGGAAGLSILPASIGSWCTLVSDGSVWRIVQAGL